MLLIQRVTSNPYQKQTLVLDDGSTVTMTLYFRSLQLGWFITRLEWNGVSPAFVLTELRITNSPNMLRQWRNKLNFGLGCFSTENREPSLIDDFSTQTSKLYILTQAECDEYNEFLETEA